MVSVMPALSNMDLVGDISTTSHRFIQKSDVPKMGGLHRSASSAFASRSALLHLRSQSVPEATALLMHPPQPPPPPPQHLQQYFVPMRISGAHLHVTPQQQQQQQHLLSSRPSNNGAPPASSTLRRSQTNAADLKRSRPSFGYQPHHVQQRLHQHHHFGSSQFLASTASSLNNTPWMASNELLLPSAMARSRCNIANLFLPVSSSAGRSCPPQTQSCKDLSQPLHVDCSIEYDLGNQPKIPRNSAPLLIIHPDYQNNASSLMRGRFHPYSNSPFPSSSAASPCATSIVSSALDDHSLSSSSGIPTSSTPNRLNLQPRGIDHFGALSPVTRRHNPTKVTRHASMLVTGNTQIPHIDSNRHRRLEDGDHLSLDPNLYCSAVTAGSSCPKQQQLFRQQRPKQQQQQQQQRESSKSGQHRQRGGRQGKKSSMSMPDISASAESRVRRNLWPKEDHHSARSKSTHSNTYFCDSGLGSPISGTATSNMEDVDNLASKWKTGVSGFMNGFLCCTGVIETDSMPSVAKAIEADVVVNEELADVEAVKQQDSARTNTKESVPDFVILETSISDEMMTMATPGKSSSSLADSGHPEEATPISGSASSKQSWIMVASSGESSSRSSSVTSSPPPILFQHRPPKPPRTFGNRQRQQLILNAADAKLNRIICPRCRSQWNSDCRDGFCAAIWNGGRDGIVWCGQKHIGQHQRVTNI